ncbi:MAG: cytochrome c oxidase subunit II [Tatlockia sp.]|nr:cytochrome c oxidase subunit II [Tatlockia sp.]
MLNSSKIMKVLTFIGLITSQVTLAETDRWQLNMYKGVTPLSHDMYDLHMIAMVICAIIGIIVFGVMIYALIHHRKSKGHKAATFHDNFRLEILWSIIPFLILLGLAIPATKVLIRLEDSSDSEVTIKVVGYQWKWQYQYLNEGISYFSNLSTPYSQIENQQKKGEWYLLEVDKPLVLPTNKKIRFLVTSNDVIHSWWVPELGVKRDAIPGFMHEAWAKIEKPGTYRGQCAELCGINHGFMPIVVQAVNEADYKQWVSQQVKTKDQYEIQAHQPEAQPNLPRAELMNLGREKYDQICAACHRADGTGLPPMYPGLKGSSIAVGNPIARHILIILNGVPGSAMQPYRDQLNDKEIAAIATYERNAWGNNTNDTVQPEEVAKVRQAEIKKPTMVEKAKVGGIR